MKTRAIILTVLMGLTTVVFAQPDKKGNEREFNDRKHEMRDDQERGPGIGLNLTDEQKEAFQKNRIETEKLLQPLHNQLGEAEARQRTLVTAEKPDLDAINKNIEKIGSLKTEMEKIRTRQQLAVRALLTDEQRLKFDHSEKRMRPDFENGRMDHRGDFSMR